MSLTPYWTVYCIVVYCVLHCSVIVHKIVLYCSNNRQNTVQNSTVLFCTVLCLVYCTGKRSSGCLVYCIVLIIRKGRNHLRKERAAEAALANQEHLENSASVAHNSHY